MPRRLLYFKLVGKEKDRKAVEEYLRRFASPGFEVEARLIKSRLPDLEYHCYVAAIAKDVLREVIRAEREGFTAVILGCFYDPLLEETRELTSKMAVVAPCQASLHLASLLGSSITIILGREKHLPKIRELTVKYGFKDRVSFKCLGLCVEDFYTRREAVRKKVAEAARQAVEVEAAEVVVLGCTALYGFFKGLQEELKVPVIDPVLASLKYAEFMALVEEQLGWRISKRSSYEAPPQDELENFLEILKFP